MSIEVGARELIIGVQRVFLGEEARNDECDSGVGGFAAGAKCCRCRGHRGSNSEDLGGDGVCRGAGHWCGLLRRIGYE